MSTGIVIKKKICKIGKKEDKSDCAKKDCKHCRHWIAGEVWKEYCTGQEYPINQNGELLNSPKD